MPYQQANTPLVHMEAALAVPGMTVVFTGNSAYDFEVNSAETGGSYAEAPGTTAVLTVGTAYTIADVFIGFGDPMITLTGEGHTQYDCQMFAFNGLVSTTALVAGTGGTNGTFALAIPAPTTGGAAATGTFTVAGGVVTAVTLTEGGYGYGVANVVLTNSAFSASAGLTGAGVTLVPGNILTVAQATADTNAGGETVPSTV